MILDKELIFSSSQAVTAAAASTDIIDQGSAANALGEELYLVITCNTAATAAGAATVNFQLQTDDNSSFSSPAILLETGDVAKTALTANKVVFKGKLPVGAERYLRVYYNVLTGPLTAGAFSAYLVKEVQA